MKVITYTVIALLLMSFAAPLAFADDGQDEYKLEKVEIEIENGMAEVEIKYNGYETHMTIASEDEYTILEAIANEIGVSIEEVKQVAEFEYEDRPQSSDDLFDDDLDVTDIDDVLSDFDDDDKRKIGFSRTVRGNGHMTNSEKGYLVEVFWATQDFAKTDAEGNIEDRETKSRGGLIVVGKQKYKLERTSSEDSETQSFSIIESSGRQESVIGKMVLTQNTKLGNFATWSGDLKFAEGSLEGSWDVSLATTSHTVRRPSVASSNDDGQGKVYPGGLSAADFRRNQAQNACEDEECTEGVPGGLLRAQDRSSDKSALNDEVKRERFWSKFFDRFFNRNSAEAE